MKNTNTLWNDYITMTMACGYHSLPAQLVWPLQHLIIFTNPTIVGDFEVQSDTWWKRWTVDVFPIDWLGKWPKKVNNSTGQCWTDLSTCSDQSLVLDYLDLDQINNIEQIHLFHYMTSLLSSVKSVKTVVQ